MKYETKQKLDALIFYGILVVSFTAMLLLMIFGHSMANYLVGVLYVR